MPVNCVLDGLYDDEEFKGKDDEGCEDPNDRETLTDIQKKIAYKVKWGVLDKVGIPPGLIRTEITWVEDNRWRVTTVVRKGGKVTRPHSWLVHYQDHEVIADERTPFVHLYEIMEVKRTENKEENND